jgi:O-antigen ligase
MRDEKFLKVVDRIMAVAFYVLAAGITFSNAVTSIAAVTIIILWFLKRFMTKNPAISVGLAAYIFILFIIWNGLSFFNTSYVFESAKGLFRVIRHMLLFMAAIDYFDSRKKIKRFLLYSLGVAFFISLNGIYQYVSGVDLIRQKAINVMDYLYRVSSSFVHSNDFGAYLIVVSTMFFSLFFSKARKFKERVLSLIVIIPVSWAIFATKSRGAWIGLIISIIILFSVKSRKLLVFILLLLLVSPLIMPDMVRQRFLDLKDIRTSGSAWERVKLWQGAFDMVKARPFLGHGVNTYSRNFPAYKPDDYPDYMYSHNGYLQMATEIGIIGAGLFITFLIVLFAGIARGIKKLDKGIYRDLYLGLFAGLVGFLCSCFVDTHLSSTTLMNFLFMYMGLLLAFKKITLDNYKITV